jgi:DNA adenine methylase
MKAPFPYFGGKSTIAFEVWQRLGKPRQYIEPFFGSGAVLLASQHIASLEVVNDLNGFLANFWRCVKFNPEAAASWADYPVSHIDLGARHQWLLSQQDYLGENLSDPDWLGDAKIAGWWVWGQCCWIGSGWCVWGGGQIPHVSDAGRGVQAIGKIPHVGDAGMGVQAIGQIPHVSDAGMAISNLFSVLAKRLQRVRITHGSWDRCLNNHYGAEETAVFLDPPYCGTEHLYGSTENVATAVEAWAKDNGDLRVAVCGLVGQCPQLDKSEWSLLRWSRGKFSYSGNKTTADECIYFSPACIKPKKQASLF